MSKSHDTVDATCFTRRVGRTRHTNTEPSSTCARFVARSRHFVHLFSKTIRELSPSIGAKLVLHTSCRESFREDIQSQAQIATSFMSRDLQNSYAQPVTVTQRVRHRIRKQGEVATGPSLRCLVVEDCTRTALPNLNSPNTFRLGRSSNLITPNPTRQGRSSNLITDRGTQHNQARSLI